MRIVWIEKRRNEKPRTIGSLLMNIVDDLRKPLFPKQSGERFRLLQIHHEPVTIVIVSGVMMVKLRRLATFVWSTGSFSIPVRYYVDAIWIRRRYQNKNRVSKDLNGIGILPGREVEGQLHRHLRGDNLG